MSTPIVEAKATDKSIPGTSTETLQVVVREGDDEVLRHMAAHENELINQRMGWLLQLQGFLFAALAFAWKDAQSLCYVLAIFGAVSAASSFITLRAAQDAHIRIRRQWKARYPDWRQRVDIHGRWNDTRGLVDWLSPWYLIPWVLVGSWAAVICLISW